MFQNSLVTYWTTCCLEPRIEAISREVEILSAYFRPSRIIGINCHYQFRLSWKHHILGFNPKFDPFCRPIIRFFERRTQVSHVYGDVTPWAFHKTLFKRPIVHTIASDKGPPLLDFLRRCNHVVAQTQTSREKLLQAGCAPQRVHLIYPGVDLGLFTTINTKYHGAKPKILFATAPREEHELAGRGAYLLLDAARACPDVQFSLLFRKWRTGHTSIKAVEDNLAANPIPNITLMNEAVQNMTELFQCHHFTIIPFTNPAGGKECPNSMVEGMACGIPVLVSTCAPIAEFVDKTSSGVCFDPDAPSLLRALEEGMSRWDELSSNARKTAEKYFSLEAALNSYANLYNSAIHEGPIRTALICDSRGAL